MDEIKIVEVKENVLADNDLEALSIKEYLKKRNIFMINLMASPGSGKTTLLVKLIKKMEESNLKVAVLEADIDGCFDCLTIKENTNAKAIQVHTNGACHMTAQMVKDALNELDLNDLDIIFIENVGNLVCPAEFDTGANINVMLLSIPEGDDKPLKYPLMFKVSNVIIFSKIDVLPVFDFNIDNCKEYITALNPMAKFCEVSSKNDIGIDNVLSTIMSFKNS